MAEGGTGAAPAPSSGGGLQDNVAGLLVYLIGILAIVFLLIEPYNKNKFVRFHCFQCIFYWAAAFALGIGVTILTIAAAMMSSTLATLVSMLGMVVWLGYFVGWVVMMIKAFQGQMWKMPVVGNFAEKYA
jgi:uncharacterized membrane protein